MKRLWKCTHCGATVPARAYQCPECRRYGTPEREAPTTAHARVAAVVGGLIRRHRGWGTPPAKLYESGRLSRSTFHRLEAGEQSELAMDRLFLICDVFGLNPMALTAAAWQEWRKAQGLTIVPAPALAVLVKAGPRDRMAEGILY